MDSPTIRGGTDLPAFSLSTPASTLRLLPLGKPPRRTLVLTGPPAATPAVPCRPSRASGRPKRCLVLRSMPRAARCGSSSSSGCSCALRCTRRACSAQVQASCRVSPCTMATGHLCVTHRLLHTVSTQTGCSMLYSNNSPPSCAETPGAWLSACPLGEPSCSGSSMRGSADKT